MGNTESAALIPQEKEKSYLTTSTYVPIVSTKPVFKTYGTIDTPSDKQEPASEPKPKDTR